MIRFLGIATLLLVAVCLALGASIALAEEGASGAAASAEQRMIEAVELDSHSDLLEI